MYPGNVDAYLANVEERREHDRRVNATTLTKRRQLETFIAKNRAKASTASQAKSKAKQLERLELIHIEGPESTVRFRFPDIEPRQGPAARTQHLAIGYPDHTVARDVHVEIDHGTRVGVVGDNGQGKTTFLRTVCGSLPPVSGEVTWGYGCQVGVYAQHVYTTLPEAEDGARVSRISGRPRHEHAADQGRGRQPAVQRRDDREANSRAERRRAGPARAGRPAAAEAQRAGARRAGQPSRRRIGRGAGRGAVRLSAARSSSRATTGTSCTAWRRT